MKWERKQHINLRNIFTLIVLGSFLCGGPLYAKTALLVGLGDKDLTAERKNVIEQHFTAHFPDGLLHFQTDSWKLWQVLQDKGITHLLYLAHMGNRQCHIPYLANKVIRDYRRANIFPLFKQVPKHLKWIGLVGCWGQDLIEELKDSSPGVSFVGLSGTVEMEQALLDILGKWEEREGENVLTSEEGKEKASLKIKRKHHCDSGEKVYPLMVGFRKKTIAVLGSQDQFEELEVSVDASLFQQRPIKFWVDSGVAGRSENSCFGTVEIEFDGDRYLPLVLGGKEIGVKTKILVKTKDHFIPLVD